MNKLSRAIYYVLLRKINRHAHTFGIATIGMLAEYTVAIGCGLLCKQLLCQQPHNNYIHSSRTVASCEHP